jgi:hypothetical protein
MRKRINAVGLTAGSSAGPGTKRNGFPKRLVPIEVFFSYSHRDERLRNELEKHLALLKRSAAIAAWHDRKIIPGENVDQAIDHRLEHAKLILLLISSDFLSSDYCYSTEMQRAMELHRAGLAQVIPIILRPAMWHDAPFGKLLALPRDGKPVTTWATHDQAFLDIVVGIKRAIDEVS